MYYGQYILEKAASTYHPLAPLPNTMLNFIVVLLFMHYFRVEFCWFVRFLKDCNSKMVKS